MAGRRRPGAQARAPAPAPLSRPHSAAKAPSFDKAGITPKLGKGEMQVLRPYGFPLTRGHDTEGTPAKHPARLCCRSEGVAGRFGSRNSQDPRAARGSPHVYVGTTCPPRPAVAAPHSERDVDLLLRVSTLMHPIAPHCPCLNLARPCFKKTDD